MVEEKTAIIDRIDAALREIEKCKPLIAELEQLQNERHRLELLTKHQNRVEAPHDQ